MSCKNNIDLRPAFNSTFNKLYKYADLTSNINSNLYKPFDDIYAEGILNDMIGFTSNITNNIDFENYSGDEDILDNKDNIFIIDNNTKNIYENCVVSSGIPWYTTNNKYNKCIISDRIKFDNNNVLKLSDDKKSITYNFKSNNKNAGFCSHYTNVNKAYCENAWYDWLIIPNFYLGNTYLKDIGKYTVNDVYKCYKPCKGDYLPFKDNNEMKCIPKELYSNGLLKNKYKYSALGLINLIGNIAYNTINNSNHLNNLTYINYYLLFYYKHNRDIDNNIYDTNDIYNNIINTIDNQEKFNKDIKNNIIKVENEFKDCIKNNIIDIDNFDNSLNQNYERLNIFTYKSLEFQEKSNDLITLNGLEYNNILIDPILIHIWILANLFKPYKKEDLIKITTITDKQQLSNRELYDLLVQNYFDGDENKNINIAIRLKNIFFRAVNVCYNNKTNFSANIINKTKKALQNTELTKLILNKGLYVSSENKRDNLYRYNYFSSDVNLTNFFTDSIEKLLDNFEEIYYYNDVELNELVYSINNKNNFVKKIIGDFGLTNQTISNNELNENNRFKYLFSIEYLEASKTCKINEIYNPVNGTCTARPQKIEDVKKEIETDNNDDIEDTFKIPKMRYLLTLFIQVVFVLIIGYIFYLCYTMFGEEIIFSLNYIYETVIYGLDNYNINKNISNIETDDTLSSGNTKEIIKNRINIVDIQLKTAEAHLENIENKTREIKNYINDNHLE